MKLRPFSNLGVKLASLGLASLLWLVIAGEKTSEMGLAVPVELQNFPIDLELTGEPVNVVEVRLRASPGVIQQLVPGQLSAQVDLAGAGEGERIVHLSEAAIRVPFGVQVVKITPAILRLQFERTLQKVVPIRPRLIGRPEAGFEVGQVLAEPAQVQVAGPRGRVHEIESAFTEPVALEGASRDVSEEVSIGLEDPTLRIQGRSRVQVRVQIRALEGRRELQVPIVVTDARLGARPASARVTVSGPLVALRALQARDIEVAAVPLPGTTRARLEARLRQALEGVRVEAIHPVEVGLRAARP